MVRFKVVLPHAPPTTPLARARLWEFTLKIRKGYVEDTVAVGALLIIVALAMVAVLILVPGTGPNCPGMDPRWLGFCTTP